MFIFFLIKTLWPWPISKAQLRKRRMTTRMVDDSAGLVSAGAVEGALASGLSQEKITLVIELLPLVMACKLWPFEWDCTGKIWWQTGMDLDGSGWIWMDLDGMEYQIFRPTLESLVKQVLQQPDWGHAPSELWGCTSFPDQPGKIWQHRSQIRCRKKIWSFGLQGPKIVINVYTKCWHIP